MRATHNIRPSDRPETRWRPNPFSELNLSISPHRALSVLVIRFGNCVKGALKHTLNHRYGEQTYYSWHVLVIWPCKHKFIYASLRTPWWISNYTVEMSVYRNRVWVTILIQWADELVRLSAVLCIWDQISIAISLHYCTAGEIVDSEMLTVTRKGQQRCARAIWFWFSNIHETHVAGQHVHHQNAPPFANFYGWCFRTCLR